MSGFLVQHTEIDGHRCAVRIQDGVVAEVAPTLTRAPGEEKIDAQQGALIAGLTDHHIHLHALAASFSSVPCGEDLRSALGKAVPDERGWIRGTGYDEQTAGDLDARALDAVRADAPVRVQHRSGALWVLNSLAAAAVGLADASHPGVERDPEGRPTGRLWRADNWLRDRLPAAAPPPLTEVGRRLARYGITSVTDATPRLTSITGFDQLPQHVLLLGAPKHQAPTRHQSPWKIVLADSALPTLPHLTEEISATHATGRPVAVHTVTSASLALLLAALRTAGPLPGDRLEHAAVVPAQALPVIKELGLRIVTQPGFLTDRGDRFLDGAEPHEHDSLYRCASFLDTGIPLALSSDAPYGPLDPWEVIRAAVSRRAPDGRTVAERERLTAARALRAYQSPARNPGGPPPLIRPGAPADLVLLRAPLTEVLARPEAEAVRATFIRGVIRYSSDVNHP